jgi:hypothetical protein
MGLIEGLNKCSNSEYHGDKIWLSSSSFKLLLKNPTEFYQQKILGIRPEDGPNAAFEEGGLTHSLILEPHLVDTEYAFWDGMRKVGPEWQAFCLQNKGKVCLSSPQKSRCLSFLRAYQGRKEAIELIKGGESEFSVCQTVKDIQMKVRADYINIDKGYIVDVKTSGMPVDLDSFKMTIDQYKYELSAAMYLTVVEQFYGKPFDFYFIVIGKKDLLCEVYKVSKFTRLAGQKLLDKAIETYKMCLSTGKWVNLEVPEKLNYNILEV